jgi:hypothetical protein
VSTSVNVRAKLATLDPPFARRTMNKNEITSDNAKGSDRRRNHRISFVQLARDALTHFSIRLPILPMLLHRAIVLAVRDPSVCQRVR